MALLTWFLEGKELELSSCLSGCKSKSAQFDPLRSQCDLLRLLSLRVRHHRALQEQQLALALERRQIEMEYSLQKISLYALHQCECYPSCRLHGSRQIGTTWGTFKSNWRHSRCCNTGGKYLLLHAVWRFHVLLVSPYTTLESNLSLHSQDPSHAHNDRRNCRWICSSDWVHIWKHASNCSRTSNLRS